MSSAIIDKSSLSLASPDSINSLKQDLNSNSVQKLSENSEISDDKDIDLEEGEIIEEEDLLEKPPELINHKKSQINDIEIRYDDICSEDEDISESHHFIQTSTTKASINTQDDNKKLENSNGNKIEINKIYKIESYFKKLSNPEIEISIQKDCINCIVDMLDDVDNEKNVPRIEKSEELIEVQNNNVNHDEETEDEYCALIKIKSQKELFADEDEDELEQPLIQTNSSINNSTNYSFELNDCPTITNSTNDLFLNFSDSEEVIDEVIVEVLRCRKCGHEGHIANNCRNKNTKTYNMDYLHLEGKNARKRRRRFERASKKFIDKLIKNPEMMMNETRIVDEVRFP